MPVETPVFRPCASACSSFRDKEIATADLKDGKGYVSIRSLCQAFGLDQRAQRKRLMRQQGYFEPYTATILMTTPGGPQPTLCLMASAVPIFLTGVELERVAGRRSARAAQSLPRRSAHRPGRALWHQRARRAAVPARSRWRAWSPSRSFRGNHGNCKKSRRGAG